MEATTDQAQPDDHNARLADTQRLLEEMERLEVRARLLLAEHRHVVDTIRDMQRTLDAAGGLPRR